MWGLIVVLFWVSGLVITGIRMIDLIGIYIIIINIHNKARIKNKSIKILDMLLYLHIVFIISLQTPVVYGCLSLTLAACCGLLGCVWC